MIYLASGEFGLQCLEELQKSHELSHVISKPKSEVWNYCMSNKMNVVEYSELKDILEVEKPEYCVLADFGVLIKEDIINLLPKGIINLHPSLLPKYRGASPIVSAMLDNNKSTGTTLMLLDVGLDTGDIIASSEISLDTNLDRIELSRRLAILSVELLNENLDKYLRGRIKLIKQNESQVSIAKKITKEDGVILLDKECLDIDFKLLDAKIRSFVKWPKVSFKYLSADIILHEIGVCRKLDLSEYIEKDMFVFNKRQLFIKIKDGFVEVISLQPESKRIMSAVDYINGFLR